MKVVNVTKRDNAIELYVKRPDKEDKRHFFATLQSIAYLLNGDAFWSGASDEIAIVRFYLEEENNDGK